MRILDRLSAAGLAAGEIVFAAASATENDVWNSAAWGVGGMGGGPSTAGPGVNSASANSLPVWYASIKILSESHGRPRRLPYRVLGEDDDRELARDLPIYRVLVLEPNRWQTPFYFQQTSMVHKLLAGNFLAELVAGARGGITEVVPLVPGRVEILDPETAIGVAAQRGVTFTGKDSDPPIYRAWDRAGRMRVLLRDEVLHVPMMGSDGRRGISVLTAAREAVGIGLAQGQFSGKFFSKGLTQRGVIHHPKHLSPKVKKETEEMIDKQMGPEGAGGLLILQEDMKFFGISVNPQEAQLLQSREFTVQEIARYFNIPLAKLGAQKEGFSYASVEQFLLDFVSATMEPHFVADEQEWNRAIPGDDIYVECDRKALLQGDMRTKWMSYSIGIDKRVFDPSYVRKLESIPESAAPEEPKLPKGKPAGKGEEDGTAPRRVKIVPEEEAKAWATQWQHLWAGVAADAERKIAGARLEETDATRARGWAEAAARALARQETRFLRNVGTETLESVEGFYHDLARKVARDLAMPQGTAQRWAEKRGNELLDGVTGGNGFDMQAFVAGAAKSLTRLALEKEGERDAA